MDFLNAIRAGGGLNPLEYSEELSADAQCKSTYTVYLSKNKISNPNPAFPPQLEGLSDEYYAKCQSGSGENLFMCGILSTNIIGSTVMPWTTVMEPGNIIAEDIAIIC